MREKIKEKIKKYTRKIGKAGGCKKSPMKMSE